MLTALFAYPVALLLTYGYKALFIWSILEGEIGLMLSGWLAYKGEVFSYYDVIFTAIAGAIIGDISVFLFGRIFEKKALKLLSKHPNKKESAMRWLRKWGPFVIVFERFIYGTHIPVLLTIGMSGFSFLKFILFDIIGIVLWAFTFVTIGYKFGEKIIEIIILAQKNIAILIVTTALIFIFLKIFKELKED